MKNSIILRFSDFAKQPAMNKNDQEVRIQRIIGFVEGRNILPLFDELDLDANPRSSKVGHVTGDIVDTLATTPELFHFKSKGILLGSARYQELDRKRFRLSFEDRAAEGILDGGHNMLGLGLHMLKSHMPDKEWKRIKFWDDLKGAWSNYRDDIDAAKDELEFLVPVELLVPVAIDEDAIDAFLMPLLDICAARNNNAQLTLEAKSNKRGFYDAIKDRLPTEFGARVEWATNSWADDEEKRPIRVRDLIAQAWIPLNCLSEASELPRDDTVSPPRRLSVTPQNIYRNKGECSAKFDSLMTNPKVTHQDGARHTLHHEGVASALSILSDLPQLYDDIYANFPEAYNSHNLRFGANPVVKIYDPDKRRELKEQGKDVKGYTNVQPSTPFYRTPVKYNYPEGLIAPLFYGLKGLMVVNDGRVAWAVDDPRDFVKRHVNEIAGSYKLVLDLGRWDPQRVAKNPASHEFAVQQFQSALAKEEMMKTNAA